MLVLLFEVLYRTRYSYFKIVYIVKAIFNKNYDYFMYFIAVGTIERYRYSINSSRSKSRYIYSDHICKLSFVSKYWTILKNNWNGICVTEKVIAQKTTFCIFLQEIKQPTYFSNCVFLLVEILWWEVLRWPQPIFYD